MKNLFSPQLFSAGRLSFFAYCFLIYEYVKKSVCMLGMKPTYSMVSAIDELNLGKEKWMEILEFYSERRVFWIFRPQQAQLVPGKAKVITEGGAGVFSC